MAIGTIWLAALQWTVPGSLAADEPRLDHNPYYESVLAALEGVTAEPEIKKEFDSCWEFRSLAERALNAAWAAGSDDSPRKGDRILIAHAAAIIDFCLHRQKEGSWFYSRKWSSGDPNCDRFTLGPIMDAIWWLRRLPDMDQRWNRWEQPLKQAVDFQYANWGCYKERGVTGNKAWGSFAFHYPNQDVFHLFEMELAHRWWNEAKYAEQVEKTISALQSQLLPHGGLHYIGPETESPVYHNLNLVWLARFLNLTDDPRIRDLLERTRRYYLLTCSNQGVAEHYTDCWWKHYWNKPSPTGPEIIAGLTGDPQHKWLADQLLQRVGAGTRYWDIYAGMFYRDEIEAKPLDDRWLVQDRNIGGPRGRFGDWYFAGVTGGGARDTFVGAMISRPDDTEPLHGALLAANVEVDLVGGPTLRISGPDDVTAVEIGDQAAALGARYTLRKPYINSELDPQVPPTAWQMTQVWLLTAEGLVGLIELETQEPQTASEVRGQIHLGPRLPVTKTGPNGFRCGDLAARVLEHNYAALSLDTSNTRNAPRHTVVTLRTEGDRVSLADDAPLWYATNAGPARSAPAEGFQHVTNESASGFRVQLGQRSYRVSFDASVPAVRIGR